MGKHWHLRENVEVFFSFNEPHPLADVENSSNFENSSFI